MKASLPLFLGQISETRGSPPLAVFPDLVTHGTCAMLLSLLRLQKTEYSSSSAAVRQLALFTGALQMPGRARSKH